MIEQAIFAAGCFWGIQAGFDALPGVLSSVVGYTGGFVKNPTYEQVCTNLTGHAEAVKIDFDNSLISYDNLLDTFFNIHDPTSLNRQGPDIGTQYRSAVFYLNDTQKQSALKKIDMLNKSGQFQQPIVTEILPADVFYPAEEKHQKYLQKKALQSCPVPNTSESHTEDAFKEKLSPKQYHVLREKGTEKPFSGKYVHFNEKGVFSCAACGAPLFYSDSKFDSKSGWPSFDQALPGSVRLHDDFSHGMIRTEVTCANCESHLGHLFQDGPTQTKNRYCINSIALNFEKDKT